MMSCPPAGTCLQASCPPVQSQVLMPISISSWEFSNCWSGHLPRFTWSPLPHLWQLWHVSLFSAGVWPIASWPGAAPKRSPRRQSRPTSPMESPMWQRGFVVVGPTAVHVSDRRSTQRMWSSIRKSRKMRRLLFFVVQSLLFLLLGCLVNRLRVAFGPPMMVLAAAVWGTKLFPSTWRSKFPRVLPVFLLFGMAGHLFLMALKLPCISDEEGICQHMADKLSNDGDLADLYDWFNSEGVATSNHPVLASMNLAGSMRAFTTVPMIIHPQPSSMCISAVFDFLLLLLPHASTVSREILLSRCVTIYSMAAERHSSEEKGYGERPSSTQVH